MRFRPGLWPTLTLVFALPVLLTLGTWQTQRLAWKTELIATMQARAAEAPRSFPVAAELGSDLDFRRVGVDATLMSEPALRFGVSRYDGRPGHRLLQAAHLADGRSIVVDRGWVASGVDRAPSPDGLTTLVGTGLWIADDERRWPVPENDAAGNRWYWYDLEALRDAFGIDVEPVVLVLETVPDGSGAGAPVPQPVVVDLPNNHLGYALTWYGLALSLVVIYGVYGRQRGKEVS